MADTLDILTDDEARDAVHLSQATPQLETKLALFVTGISRRIDELCGPVVQRTVVERHSGSHGHVVLRVTPVASITTVVEWDAAGTSTTLTAETDASKPADGYLLDSDYSHFARLLRRSGGSGATFAYGDNNVVVTYTAGRYEDSDSVDPMFKLAAMEILASQWQQAASSWSRSPDLGDEFGQPGFISVDAMVRSRLPNETLPLGVA